MNFNSQVWVFWSWLDLCGVAPTQCRILDFHNRCCGLEWLSIGCNFSTVWSTLSCLLPVEKVQRKQSLTHALCPSVGVSSVKIKQRTNPRDEVLVTLAITSAPLDQSARSPGVASLLIRDFYCIISPASVSFYTVQWHFMLSVNTCLYKVVCCLACV